jgi:hypothetical protein
MVSGKVNGLYRQKKIANRGEGKREKKEKSERVKVLSFSSFALFRLRPFLKNIL